MIINTIRLTSLCAATGFVAWLVIQVFACLLGAGDWAVANAWSYSNWAMIIGGSIGLTASLAAAALEHRQAKASGSSQAQ